MPNRVICSVLDEIRKCHETRNYSYLMGLVEEAQTLANRMEAALYTAKDIKFLEQDKRRLKKEVEELEEKKKFLEDKK